MAKLPADNLADMQSLVDELSKESDRGAVLLAASRLEAATKALIAQCMIDEAAEAQTKEAFRGNGPFSNFSSCIEVCYLLGLISKGENQALHLIRRIRNDFAHSPSLKLNLEEGKFAQQCRELTSRLPKEVYEHVNQSTAKQQFCNVCSMLIVNLVHMRTHAIVRPPALGELLFEPV